MMERTQALKVSRYAVIAATVAITFGITSWAMPSQIPGAVVQVGIHLCKANEGLKSIERTSMALSKWRGHTYTFVCDNSAHFLDVRVTIAEAKPAPEPVATQRLLSVP